MHFSYLPCMLYSPPISLIPDLITLMIFVEAYELSIFSLGFSLRRPSQGKMLPSAPCSETLYVFPIMRETKFRTHIKLTNELTLWRRGLLSLSKNSLTFMEPADSLPCSQGQATGPYPEAYASSPHTSTLFP